TARPRHVSHGRRKLAASSHPPQEYFAHPTGPRRPASVIRTWVTSIHRPPATTCSVLTVASPAIIVAASMSIVKPCARMIASVAPPGEAASNSSALRRVAGGLRLRLVGIGREYKATYFH